MERNEVLNRTKECQAAIVGCQYYEASMQAFKMSLPFLQENIYLKFETESDYPDSIGVYCRKDRIGSISEDYLNTVRSFILEAEYLNKKVYLDYVVYHKLLPDGRLRWFIGKFIF